MVRWTAQGHTETRRSRGGALRWAAIAAIAIGATSASAAEVSEVRVGTHEKSTRLVLELDQATGYRLVTPQEGKPELIIQLNATSIARDVPSKSPFVRKVTVEPTENGSTVHVRLATANVDVKELLLANPPRLVFDLTARGPIPKIADEEKVEEPVAETTASTEPAAAKIEEPKAEPEEAAPIVVAAAEAPKPTPPPVEVVRPIEEKPAMPPAPVDPVPDAAEPPSMPIAQPSAPAEVPPPAAHAAPAPPMPASPPPTANAETRRSAIAAKAATQAPASDGSLMSMATTPMGLGVIGAVVLLLGLVVVMRRRRSREDQDPLYTVMSADDAGTTMDAEEQSPVRAAPIWEPDAFEASEPTPKTGPHQFSFGARPEPTPEPEADEIAPPDDSDSIFGSEPEPPVVAQAAPVAVVAATPSSVAGADMSEETERRLAELERRIEQLAEARERLERQVAAQTEELRVQRAAIARTQRVVRSIAKTEDMATEPVPRAPSAS
jgi:hypothetical protein